MTLNPDIMLWKLKADAEMKRAEAAETEVRTLRNAGVDLLNRAEAAEKDRDEYFLQWQNLRLNGTAHWQQLAKAAEKREAERFDEATRFLLRAEAAEKERDRLRLVLERISNAKPRWRDIARAALEAKP